MNMRLGMLNALLLVAFFTFSVTASAQNLLVNPGFEILGDFSGWSLYNITGPKGVAVDNTPIPGVIFDVNKGECALWTVRRLRR